MSTELSPWGRAYIAKKPLFSFLGRTFHILGPEGNLRFYVKMKAFRLKEDITVFADEGQTKPMLRIQARRRSDFASAYDVTDITTGENVGACKREGMKSMLRDEWTLLSAEGTPIGKLQEDSMLMALIRRFLIKGWIPQSYSVSSAGGAIGNVKQRFNPFQLVYDVAFDGPNANALDPRLGVALVVLLLAIEGRQE